MSLNLNVNTMKIQYDEWYGTFQWTNTNLKEYKFLSSAFRYELFRLLAKSKFVWRIFLQKSISKNVIQIMWEKQQKLTEKRSKKSFYKRKPNQI